MPGTKLEVVPVNAMLEVTAGIVPTVAGMLLKVAFEPLAVPTLKEWCSRSPTVVGAKSPWYRHKTSAAVSALPHRATSSSLPPK